jgi:hypothetical protein
MDPLSGKSYQNFDDNQVGFGSRNTYQKLVRNNTIGASGLNGMGVGGMGVGGMGVGGMGVGGMGMGRGHR